MARFFRPQIIKGKTQAIGNKITEGHGIIPNIIESKVNIVEKPASQSITQNVSKLTENQTKYLKILKPKQYIAFD
jgi:hypothetical protein